VSPDTGGFGAFAQTVGDVRILLVETELMEVKTGQIVVGLPCWRFEARNIGLKEASSVKPAFLPTERTRQERD
jgi:hypothetical protein